MKNTGKLPPWLKRRLPANPTYDHTRRVIGSLGIETICTNANCPNKGLCWETATATVLILGNICTRNCKFCSVAHGKPAPPDPAEPKKIATMAKQINLKYLVITSVDRDDLADGGAQHFANVVNQCRKDIPELKFELLVPDFKNCQDKAIEILKPAMPFVFGHNIETVPALYQTARPGGDYKTSLNLLKKAAIDTEGFDFGSVSWLDDPMFLPGILRYGGIDAMWLLNRPYKTIDVKGADAVLDVL